MGVHLHPTFVMANRHEIEDEIERLIGLLDACDAPFEDLEPEDELSDLELYGEGERFLPLLPVYGVDQSKGPTNEREAYRAWQRSLR